MRETNDDAPDDTLTQDTGPHPSESGAAFRHRVVIAALLLNAVLLAGVQLHAQEPAPSPPLGVAPAEPPPAPDPLLPDVPAKWVTYSGRLFSTKASVALLYDYTLFDQDEASRQQVGLQEDASDLRAGRLLLSGQIKFHRPWSYMIAGDYNETREPEDRIFDGIDLFVTIPLWGHATVSVGKQKEPFVYEMVGDASSLPQNERILSPFFVSRSVGVKVSDTALDARMTWSAGWFNDWLADKTPFSESGNDFAVRVTGLPVVSGDGSRYLHVAIGARYTGATQGVLRFRGRPESNVAGNYVDTGNFEGDSLRAIGAEVLWTDGPFSTLAEVTPARTDAPAVGNPRFSGYSVVTSYVLTGEHRPYNRRGGYAGRLIPRSRLGAWEIFGRYSTIDLTDRRLDGGDLEKVTAGLNWWATRQWKFSVGAGRAALDRKGLHGHTTITLLRSQWTF